MSRKQTMNSDEEKRKFVPAAWKNGSLCRMISGKLCYNHTNSLGLLPSILRERGNRMDSIDLRILLDSPEDYLGRKVKLQGWIRNHRKQKSFGFIDFFDGTCFASLQVVYDNSLPNFAEVRPIAWVHAFLGAWFGHLIRRKPQGFSIK